MPLFRPKIERSILLCVRQKQKDILLLIKSEYPHFLKSPGPPTGGVLMNHFIEVDLVSSKCLNPAVNPAVAKLPVPPRGEENKSSQPVLGNGTL
jgi:hypothetical protein